MDDERARLLYKIARAYYDDDLTQQEIGRRYGLSRIKVSRLLRKARDLGIVQIQITPPADDYAELERALAERYGLDEAVIAPAPPDGASVTAAVGAAAARCLLRSLQGREVLALTWGTTLLAAVEAMPTRSWPACTVVQCLGSLGPPDADVHGVELVRRLAQRLGGRARLLPAPGIVATPGTRDALLREPQIADTLALAAQADVALVGIGVVSSPSSVVRRAGTILTEQEIVELQELGAVGDIALRFFDRQGLKIRHSIDRRVIGLDLGQLRGIKRVIGAAGGPDKFDAILGALRGKWIHVLVTDDQTALQLLGQPGV